MVIAQAKVRLCAPCSRCENPPWTATIRRALRVTNSFSHVSFSGVRSPLSFMYHHQRQTSEQLTGAEPSGGFAPATFFSHR
jgi:hypothetical protein